MRTRSFAAASAPSSASSASACGSCGSILCADVPCLRVEVHGPFPALPAEAGVLHAAKRDGKVAHEPAVDPHHPRLQGFSHPLGLSGIFRPDGGGKAVAHPIGEADRFLLGGELLDGGDRAENLLL